MKKEKRKWGNISFAVPDAPTNLTAHLVNATCIKVTWSPPEKSNGLLIYYKVSMNPPDPPLTEVLPPTATSWCFSSDFQPNTTYTFWVSSFTWPFPLCWYGETWLSGMLTHRLQRGTAPLKALQPCQLSESAKSWPARPSSAPSESLKTACS